MAITGTFDRSIDEKLRLAIPKQLREAFGISNGGELFLAPGNEGCIAVYSPRGFEEFAQRVANTSPGRADVRTFLRLFYSRAERVVLDKQSRIRIPERLLESDRTERDMVILGVHDHAEIWHRNNWDVYMNQNLSMFDELTSEALEPPDVTRPARIIGS
ncbi:MAG: cell division protein [Fuerstiella sp.]|nr:cell division protein [Fuerstiella sp.]